MKIDRLLSMTILLLNRRKMTAPDLADYFEVSVRTVYRDVETLNRSGIPVVTFRGQGGGLCIPDHYKLSRQLLTFSDMVSILTTLKGINKTLNNKEITRAIEKITALIPREKEDQYQRQANSFLVDIRPWGSPGLHREAMEKAHEGITRSKQLYFDYAKPGHRPGQRCVEPYTLAFKGWTWYLLGFCRTRMDFRVFKLSRMRKMRLGREHFARKEISPERFFSPDYQSGPEVSFTLRFKGRIKSKMEEYVAQDAFLPEGNHWRVTLTLPHNDWLYSFILGLGPEVEVLSPPEIREAVIEKINLMKKNIQT
ncbi:MAG: YafY family transcriptional regulator [Desulfobacterales bacterium]|nr:YafY family transcriptional regulator [Desulfobacterales bacterium]